MSISVLGIGDNVVDKYLHSGIMYPGGNALNFSVYAKLADIPSAARTGCITPATDRYLSLPPLYRRKWICLYPSHAWRSAICRQQQKRRIAGTSF